MRRLKVDGGLMWYAEFSHSEAFMELQMTQFFLGGEQNPLVCFRCPNLQGLGAGLWGWKT